MAEPTVDQILAAIPLPEVLGAIVIAVSINAFFYGFSVLQFVQYRTRIFRDNWSTQLLVTWTFVIDSAHTIALCWLLWSYIVDNFVNPLYLTSAPWPSTTTPLFLSVTATPIQVYFGFRVYKLSRSRVLLYTIIGLSAVNTSLGLVATIFVFTHADVNDFKLLLPIIDSWLGGALICDGLTSACLIYYLTRSDSGFRHHQSYRNRVAHAFIESSILTSIFVLADLIIYSTVPNTNYHIIVGFPMGRIYTSTLLAMLNSRLKLREDEADGIISKESQSYERRVDFANAFNKMKRSAPQVRVSVAVQERVDVVLDHHRRTSLSRTTSNGVGTYSPASGLSSDLDHKPTDLARVRL